MKPFLKKTPFSQSLAHIFVLSSLINLCGCSWLDDADDPSNGLFPMRVGTEWTYTLESDLKDPSFDQTIVMSVDREVNLKDQKVRVRRSADGVEYYIKRDQTGIYRIASRTDIEDQAKMDETPRYILKTPIQIGTSWQSTTVPYVLRRPNEFPKDLKKTHKTIMTYTITKLNETVDVPAGKYTGCVLVRGEASLKVFTGPLGGLGETPVVSQEWYCPKVGLVKFEREEQLNGMMMSGGKISYVLTDIN